MRFFTRKDTNDCLDIALIPCLIPPLPVNFEDIETFKTRSESCGIVVSKEERFIRAITGRLLNEAGRGLWAIADEPAAATTMGSFTGVTGMARSVPKWTTGKPGLRHSERIGELSAGGEGDGGIGWFSLWLLGEEEIIDEAGSMTSATVLCRDAPRSLRTGDGVGVRGFVHFITSEMATNERGS